MDPDEMNKGQGRTQYKKRVAKSDWLDAAIGVLSERGVEAIRVERLAAQLEISKSGFYYHFADRQDLLDAMLAHWLELDRLPMVRARQLKQLTPREILENTLETAQFFHLGRMDFAIRQWAMTDEKVAAALEKQNRVRLTHVRQQFEQLGFEGEDLEMRVLTFVSYVATEEQLFSGVPKSKRARLWKRRLDLLLSHPH